MRLHDICLDFDGDEYLGKEGRNLHLISFKILAALLRESLDSDIDHLMFTNEEVVLAEAQERMYKSETRHTWDHFTEMCQELRVINYENRDHMNSHIKQVNEALQNLMVEVNGQGYGD